MKQNDAIEQAINAYIMHLPEVGHGRRDDMRLMEIAYVAYRCQEAVPEEYLKDQLREKFACSEEYAKQLCQEACKTIEDMRYNVILLDNNQHLK